MLNIPQELSTARLRVRPFRMEDFPGFLEFMLDREATRYLMFSPEQKSPKGAREMFDGIVASYNTESPVFSLALEIRDGTFIGSCGFSPLPSEGIYECYYSLNPPFWGQGYAAEAMKELIQYVLSENDVKEVRAYVSPQNPRSASVARRAGMEKKGVTEHPVFGNEALLYSIESK